MYWKKRFNKILVYVGIFIILTSLLGFSVSGADGCCVIADPGNCLPLSTEFSCDGYEFKEGGIYCEDYQSGNTDGLLDPCEIGVCCNIGGAQNNKGVRYKTACIFESGTFSSVGENEWPSASLGVPIKPPETTPADLQAYNGNQLIIDTKCAVAAPPCAVDVCSQENAVGCLCGASATTIATHRYCCAEDNAYAGQVYDAVDCPSSPKCGTAKFRIWGYVKDSEGAFLDGATVQANPAQAGLQPREGTSGAGGTAGMFEIFDIEPDKIYTLHASKGGYVDETRTGLSFDTNDFEITSPFSLTSSGCTPGEIRPAPPSQETPVDDNCEYIQTCQPGGIWGEAEVQDDICEIQPSESCGDPTYQIDQAVGEECDVQYDYTSTTYPYLLTDILSFPIELGLVLETDIVNSITVPVGCDMEALPDSERCRQREYCGDGIISRPNDFDEWEDCDPSLTPDPHKACPGDSTCEPDANCKCSVEVSVCGDGVYTVGYEQCDGTVGRDIAGFWCYYSETQPKMCLNTPATLGGPEEDLCECPEPEEQVCGDGTKDPGEECDFVDDNYDTEVAGSLCVAGLCSPPGGPGECTCLLTNPVCGDSAIEAAEECDPPTPGSTSANCAGGALECLDTCLCQEDCSGDAVEPTLIVDPELGQSHFNITVVLGNECPPYSITLRRCTTTEDMDDCVPTDYDDFIAQNMLTDSIEIRPNEKYLHKDISVIASTITPRTKYCYKVNVTYPDIMAWNSIEKSNPDPVCLASADDPDCLDPDIREICSGNQIISCDENNHKEDPVDCADNEICLVIPPGGPECVVRDPCEDCNGFLGLFATSGWASLDHDNDPTNPDQWTECSTLNTCYMDYSKTIVDKYNSCYQDLDGDGSSKKVTCYNYKSRDACIGDTNIQTAPDQKNPYLKVNWSDNVPPSGDDCGVGQCEWVESTNFSELGVGLCRPKEFEKQSCNFCQYANEYKQDLGNSQPSDDNPYYNKFNSPNMFHPNSTYNRIFGKCTEEMCHMHGWCYWDESKATCAGPADAKCPMYKRQNDCTGSSGNDATVFASYDSLNRRFKGNNNITFRSEDYFELGVCMWNSTELTCHRNADNDSAVYLEDNCIDLVHHQDITPPITVVVADSIQGKDIKWIVSRTDDISANDDTSIRTWFNFVPAVIYDPDDFDHYPNNSLYGGQGVDPTEWTRVVDDFWLNPIVIRLDDGTNTPKEITFELNRTKEPGGDYILTYYSKDAANNLEIVKNYSIYVDIFPPKINITTNPRPINLSSDEWYTNLTINVIVNESDGSYCNSSLYHDAGGGLAEYMPYLSFGTLSSPEGLTVPRHIPHLTGWFVEYPLLEDGIYFFKTTCIDNYGNVNDTILELSLEADKSVTNPRAEGRIWPTFREDLFGTNLVIDEISVETANPAFCVFEEDDVAGSLDAIIFEDYEDDSTRHFDYFEEVLDPATGKTVFRHIKESLAIPVTTTENQEVYRFLVKCRFYKEGTPNETVEDYDYSDLAAPFDPNDPWRLKDGNPMEFGNFNDEILFAWDNRTPDTTAKLVDPPVFFTDQKGSTLDIALTCKDPVLIAKGRHFELGYPEETRCAIMVNRSLGALDDANHLVPPNRADFVEYRSLHFEQQEVLCYYSHDNASVRDPSVHRPDINYEPITCVNVSADNTALDVIFFEIINHDTGQVVPVDPDEQHPILGVGNYLFNFTFNKPFKSLFGINFTTDTGGTTVSLAYILNNEEKTNALFFKPISRTLNPTFNNPGAESKARISIYAEDEFGNTYINLDPDLVFTIDTLPPPGLVFEPIFHATGQPKFIDYPFQYVSDANYDDTYFTNNINLFLTGTTPEAPSDVTIEVNIDPLMVDGIPLVDDPPRDLNYTVSYTQQYEEILGEAEGGYDVAGVPLAEDANKGNSEIIFATIPLGFFTPGNYMGFKDSAIPYREEYRHYGEFYRFENIADEFGETTTVAISPSLEQTMSAGEKAFFYSNNHHTEWFGIDIGTSPSTRQLREGYNSIRGRLFDNFGNGAVTGPYKLFYDANKPVVLEHRPNDGSTAQVKHPIEIIVKEQNITGSGMDPLGPNLTVTKPDVPSTDSFEKSAVSVIEITGKPGYALAGWRYWNLSYDLASSEPNGKMNGTYEIRFNASDYALNFVNDSSVSAVWSFLADPDAPRNYSLRLIYSTPNGQESPQYNYWYYAPEILEFDVMFGEEPNVTLEPNGAVINGHDDYLDCTLTATHNLYHCVPTGPFTFTPNPTGPPYYLNFTVHKIFDDLTISKTRSTATFKLIVDNVAPTLEAEFDNYTQDDVDLTTDILVPEEDYEWNLTVDFDGSRIYTSIYEAKNIVISDLHIPVTVEGDYNLDFTVTDFAGHSFTLTKPIHIDETLPGITISSVSPTLEAGVENYTTKVIEIEIIGAADHDDTRRIYAINERVVGEETATMTSLRDFEVNVTISGDTGSVDLNNITLGIEDEADFVVEKPLTVWMDLKPPDQPIIIVT
ncbi:hypothetical protein ACFL0W_06335 [Nanoarchaeota archaeon]